MRHQPFLPGRLAILVALLLLLWGCGAAAGDGPADRGGDMREPAPAPERPPLPDIDRNPPSGLKTATFAMG